MFLVESVYSRYVVVEVLYFKFSNPWICSDIPSSGENKTIIN
jgi:hypothetical protein